jgi:outer membrane protein TolC
MVAELHPARQKGDLMLCPFVASILLALPLAGAAAEPSSTAAASAADSAASTAPPVEDLVRQALDHSPAVAAARARVAARREMERPAGALPDPMVEGMLQNAGTRWTLGDEEMSMLAAEVRQALPYPGKRGAARNVAASQTAEAQAELNELERQVASEVRSLYARIYAIDREGETLAAARQLLDLFSETTRGRYAAGEAEQEAVLKAQIQSLRVDEQAGDLDSDRRRMVAELNRWLDHPGDAPVATVATVPSPRPADIERAPELAATSSPEVARARAAIVTAERRVEVARLDLKPNFSVGTGLGYRGSMAPVVIARFGVELPFWRRQKQLPMLRAAEQELEMTRRELADSEAMARAEGARIAAEWRNADEQARRYREGILPQTDAALDAARSAYLAGRADFSTVIEDFGLWLEARMNLARREADRFTAAAAFERLTGPTGASRSNP